MNTRTVFLASVFLIASVHQLKAQNNYTLCSYVAAIKGTSSLCAWNANVEKMTGAGAVQQNAGKNNTLQSFCIVMQANSIKSDKGPIFDSKTHKALKVDKYPEITFLLAEPVTGIPAGAGGYELSARGRLTIAGVTRLVTMSIKITLGCDKKITIAGSQQVKMTDYGIEPPAALFGIIKTGNIITISFSATFTPAMITETGIDKPVR